jgi:hypothetical protein
VAAAVAAVVARILPLRRSQEETMAAAAVVAEAAGGVTGDRGTIGAEAVAEGVDRTETGKEERFPRSQGVHFSLQNYCSCHYIKYSHFQ